MWVSVARIDVKYALFLDVSEDDAGKLDKGDNHCTKGKGAEVVSAHKKGRRRRRRRRRRRKAWRSDKC